jgi:hypothetical protein
LLIITPSSRDFPYPQRAQEQVDLVASIHAAVLQGLKGKEKDILSQCVVDLEALAATR